MLAGSGPYCWPNLPVIRAVHVRPETTAEDVFDTISGMPAAGVMLDTGSATARGGTGEIAPYFVVAAAPRAALSMREATASGCDT